MSIDKTKQGVLLGFLAFALFSISDANVKLLFGSIPPIQSAFIGAVFGCLLLPFIKKPNETFAGIFHTENRPLWLVRFFAYPMGIIGSVTAFTHLSMAEAMVLMFLQPAYVTVLSIFFLKEKVGWQRWLAIIIGFIGVLIVLRPGFRPLSIGHVGAIFAGLGGAISIVVFRSQCKKESGLSLVGAGLIGAVIVCGLLSARNFVMPDYHQCIFLAGYGILAALANILTIRASLLAEASLIGDTQYAQMLWAVILDYLLFHTEPDKFMFIGIVFILVSSVITIMRERKHGKVIQAPLGGARYVLSSIFKHHISRNNE